MELLLIILILLSLIVLIAKQTYILIDSNINWYEELTKPAHQIDWKILLRRAASWRTCAVAVHYKGEKDYKNIPYDENVASLGMTFYKCIKARSATNALKALDKIVNYKPKKSSF